MNTRRFPTLLEIYKRDNDGKVPDIVEMSRETAEDFATSGIEANDGNVLWKKPGILRKIWNFVSRKPKPGPFAVRVYGLRVVLKKDMRNGMVQISRSDEL